MFGVFRTVNSHGYQVAVSICQSFTSLKVAINMAWHLTGALRRLLFSNRDEQDVLRAEVIDDSSDKIIKLYHELREEMASFGDMSIDFEEKAFYDILLSLAHKYDFTYPEDKLLELSKEVKELIDDKARYTDWSKRDDIKAALQFDLMILLEA